MLMQQIFCQEGMKKYLFTDMAFDFIINSEYDQEIPQSQTADKPMAPWRRATQQSQDTRNI